MAREKNALHKIIIAIIALVCIFALSFWFMARKAQEVALEQIEEAESPVSIDEAPPSKTTPKAIQETPLEQEAPLQEEPTREDTPPSFDTWWVAPDGQAVIAGQAESRAQVRVLIDGLEVARTKSNASGEFAFIFTLPPNENASLMTLEADTFDGRIIASLQSVALAPIKGAPSPQIIADVADETAASGDADTLAPEQIAALPPAILVDENGEVEIMARPKPAPEPAPEPPQQPLQEDTAMTAAVVPDVSEPENSNTPVTQVEPDTSERELTLSKEADKHAAEGENVESAVASRGVVQSETVEGDLAQGDAAQNNDGAEHNIAQNDAAQNDGQDSAEQAVPTRARADAQHVEPPQNVQNAQSAARQDTQTDSAPLQEVFLGAIVYTDTGAVKLSGTGAPAYTVRIYLNNAPQGDVTIADDGTWHSVLSAIAPDIYTLRLDQLSAQGGVTSRFETPFKREHPAIVRESQNTAAQNTAALAQSSFEDSAPPPAPAAQEVSDDAPPPPAQTPPPPPLPVQITVQPGASLWRIARERYGQGTLYVQVFNANRDQIKNPDLIYPGQLLALPKVEN